MEQYVIKTGIKARGKHYVSKFFFGYGFTEKAHVFVGLNELNSALSWTKKHIQDKIKDLKKEINDLSKEVKKGNISINKVMLDKSKESLKEYESMKIKAIKL